MMKKPICFVAILSVLFLLPFLKAHAQEDSAQYIAVYAVYCPTEWDVIELAEARSGHVFSSLLTKKIQSGKCSPPSQSNKKVGKLIKKYTPNKGVPYFCFREEVEKGQFGDTFYCVLSRYISTFQHQVAKRTGDYILTSQSSGFYKVQCKEGGTVTLEKRADTFYRISDAFQLTMRVPHPSPVIAGKDLDAAIRNGCRGVDYLLDESNY